jgi:aminodeoxyfutalosine deaminase
LETSTEPQATAAPRTASLLLRARLVLPVSGPLVCNGAVLISGNRIAAVGRWRDLPQPGPGKTLDLGDAILMPGLINAHCHLDYTHMAGQLIAPKLFSDWLKLITTAKGGWSDADYAQSWLDGAKMLVRTGTTTVADMEAVADLLPKLWKSTPLRVFSFLEMISVKPERHPSRVLQHAAAVIEGLRSSRCRAGLSPHAPYTTVPELLRLSARTARRRRWLLATHVAESALEYQMFARGNGEMYDWLRRSGRDMSDCALGTPVQHLERCGFLDSNVLVAHANYLGRKDAVLLGRRGVHVVHCPRSHAYFRHDPFPIRRLARAGVNLCLGTDSLASVYKPRRQQVELNLFEEMRALATAHPWLSSRKIVRMATLNGARALGLGGRIGQLSEAAFADLIAIPFTGRPAQAYDAILHHTGDVSASMINGKWAMAPNPR